MAYGPSYGHVTDGVTWLRKVKLITPIRLESNISKTAGLPVSLEMVIFMTMHENQGCPPSLFQDGKLLQGKMSDLDCLISSAECCSDTIILDGAALVNMLKLVDCKISDDYAANIYLPYIEKQLEWADRVDIVWDQYPENSLKSETRKCRGKGTKQQQSLRLDANKQELLHFWLDTRRECRT